MKKRTHFINTFRAPELRRKLLSLNSLWSHEGLLGRKSAPCRKTHFNYKNRSNIAGTTWHSKPWLLSL
jgi:hypothetical protein